MSFVLFFSLPSFYVFTVAQYSAKSIDTTLAVRGELFY